LNGWLTSIFGPDSHWLIYLLGLGLIRYLILDVAFLGYHLLYLRFYKSRFDRGLQLLRLEQPLVSILVPGKNEGPSLARLIRSLQEQTYRHYELIVVDDGSNDYTPQIGRMFERKGLIDLFIRHDIRGGKASAANTALRYAKGQFIVHLDADSSLNRDALERILVPFYVFKNLGGVAGALRVRNMDINMLTKLQGIEYLKSITVGRIVSYHLGWLRMISGAFGAFRTDALRRVGGWDVGPGLDGDITVKLRKMGYHVYFEPNALAKTNVPTTGMILLKQRLRWSRSLIRFRLKKHRNVFFPIHSFQFKLFMSFFENVFINFLLIIGSIYLLLDTITRSNLFRFDEFLLGLAVLISISMIKLVFVLYFLAAEKKEYHLVVYSPLMIVYYGFFVRFVSIIAAVDELFYKSSYQDAWNPSKTSAWAKHEGL
jgi:poly-beta-1,6-N-acetyl-D-glucosamine synthase